MKKRLSLLKFARTRVDIRVLHQIDYLSPDYDLTVIGHGAAPALPPGAQFVEVPAFTRLSRIVALFWLILGKVWPYAYELWFWSTRRHRAAFRAVLASNPDAIHANDWSALPVAVRVKRQTGAKVVFDAHEYAPLQFGNRRLRVLLYSPAIVYMLRKYAAEVDASMTVCTPIAERYREEFGFDMQIVMNAPRLVTLPEGHKSLDPDCIRLVHHGGALRDRGLELMIEALAKMDSRFHLDFMLMPSQPGYLDDLKRLAARLTPGRVIFREPVAPNEIVDTLSAYDVGFCIIQPTNYNYLMALPNKLFEYLAAGLAVCVGPSPVMAEVVNAYQCGVVAADFSPSAIADALNRVSIEEITVMQQAAKVAARSVNADTEMAKVLRIYSDLLGQP